MREKEQEHQQRHYISKNNVGFRYCSGIEIGIKIGDKCNTEREEEERCAPEEHLQQKKKND